jgi:hypothetical protein
MSTFKMPTSAGQTTEGKTRTTFVEPGRVAGDVLLFRLDNGKFLGSYSFSAKNRPISPSDTFERLEADLLQDYTQALDAASQARTPSLARIFKLAK